ncbi:MAG: hypothetical protein Kow0032_25820 [Methyloligellaceae bacterium]
MSSETTSMKTLISSALVAAVVSAAGIGLFVAGMPAQPPLAQQETAARSQPAATPAASKTAAQQQKSLVEENREAFEALIRDYLLKNPEVLIEVSNALEQRQNERRQQARLSAISQNADTIYRASNPLIAGNPEGNVTIVEFSDYNCPYCRRAFNHLAQLLEEDTNVKVIFKEFPIFGEGSEGAARVAIAASRQGRYFDVHSALLRSSGRLDEKAALRIAEELGLDMDKLREDMKSDATQQAIAETRELAKNLGIQGTPFYLVGDQVIPGAPDNLLDEFKLKIAEIRKNGCKAKC